MMALLVSIFFVLGYTVIALEHPLRVNKAASALLTGILCWSAIALGPGNKELVTSELAVHISEIAGILFFLLGAMVIVELIDAHDGFQIITDRIRTSSKKKLVWIIGFLTFFLSAVLDNLTTAIVMVSILPKLFPSSRDRLLFAGLVVIAANAGGAWSPIGDVTTTMLWMGGQVTAVNIILKTFIPSLAGFLVSAVLVGLRMKGKVEYPAKENEIRVNAARDQKVVFAIGLLALLFVPVFKTITHLPPYMGILFGLGSMWLLTEMIHSEKDESEKGALSVNYALRRIDTPSILFFLGILLSVSALESVGVLSSLAGTLERSIGNISIISLLIGLLSAVVDNVPLVAAVQGMYSQAYPTDHYFWEFLAYCAGTGGSLLIIGSAAGIAAMGMQRIRFFWYLRNISWIALAGYLAGAAVFLLQHYLIRS